MKSGDDLWDYLRVSIRQAVGEVLGEQNAVVFVEYFKMRYSIPMEQIDEHVKEFSSALASFGTGGQVLGRAIAKKLFIRLGLDYVEDFNKTLYDYVRIAQASVGTCQCEPS